MKFWLRIGLSLCLIIAALTIIYLLKTIPTQVATTGHVVLITGGSVSLVAGLVLFLSALSSLMKQVGRTVGVKGKERKTETLTNEEIVKKLEEGLTNTPSEYLESKFVFNAASIASYLKKRGVSRGRLSPTGRYLTYEIWAHAVKKVADELLKNYPHLRKQSYTLDLFSRSDPYLLSRLLEPFSHLYEELTGSGLNYVPKKNLKALSSIISSCT